jgi:hypothetical protein
MAVLQKVLCPQCRNKVIPSRKSNQCPICHAVLPKDATEVQESGTNIYHQSLYTQILDQDANFRGIKLASFEAVPRTRSHITVQPGKQVLLLGRQFQEPESLGPGAYKVATILARKEDAGKRGASAGSVAQEFLCVCTVEPEQVYSATFVLPDRNHVRESLSDEKVTVADMETALRSAGLRTADDLLGWVTVQMELRIVSAPKLLGAFGADHLERPADRPPEAPPAGKKDLENIDVSESPGESRWGQFWSWLGWLTPSPNLHVELKDFTLADLYPRIRPELVRVIAASIRNLSAEELRGAGAVDVRERVERDIQRDMNQTLQQLGIQITRVCAFDFRCSDYEQYRDALGQASLEQKMVEAVAREVEAQKARNDILKSLNEQQITHEGELARVELLEQAKTNLEEDRMNADRAARLRAEQAKQAEHELRLEEAKAQAVRARQLDDLRQIKAIEEQSAAAQHSREMEVFRLVMDLPMDKAQFLLAAKYRHLVDAIKSRNQEQMAQQLLQMSTTDKEQLQKLLIEFIKQTGHVAGKLLDANSGVKEEVVTVRQLPADGGSGK